MIYFEARFVYTRSMVLFSKLFEYPVIYAKLGTSVDPN